MIDEIKALYCIWGRSYPEPSITSIPSDSIGISTENLAGSIWSSQKSGCRIQSITFPDGLVQCLLGLCSSRTVWMWRQTGPSRMQDSNWDTIFGWDMQSYRVLPPVSRLLKYTLILRETATIVSANRNMDKTCINFYWTAHWILLNSN